MIDFLLGVPGKLTNIYSWLTTYWTAARAAKLDLITVAPAPASTAVSNADYTSARAAKLDFLTATPLSAVINSIQTGSVTLVSTASGTFTISAVNTAKTILIPLGCMTWGSVSTDNNFGIWALTNSTTVTVSRTGSSQQVAFGCMVVEFK